MSRINLENSGSPAQSVSDRLLTLLKTRGPQQASDAGKVLGTTGEAARQQFVKLAKDGLVEAVAETRGVGRPVQLWHLTAAGNARFPDTHSELTVQLLRTVRDKLGEQAIELLIDTREQETRINYKQAMIGATDLQERVARLTAIRCREGYMAESSLQEDGSFLLVENHCPICAAAAVCQGFCRAELSVFTEVLQAQVERSEHILSGARRCAYRISLL
ncbi:iron-sulfur cluster biosynthesis transcriptional regulator SufR [Serratia quinivorans]|jgi:predicted ArsR family transcriptional regulator|uniref:helix-turn-helix transcriptional regulator n=1 Tax=Serratia quinivorans TaxID=137545 RepID=UPI00217BFE08|nr:metalloregulator ArsR/SmtB family transcription factor [Serratia quinivorans]CAI0765815.1 iron-sulfur cluster biosynthesis transcriptional regulator SufR [Serratia quinivorans]CAI1142815.1 iron-sulfur cluster biosynthesis transcriptional regulator SufR [Serratia quinivorans]CAI1709387.1 iron-sulfur cluster biosynthesis transcriptional regulator SufR [Serratia quinivorans]CAI1796009.1 iron-sulfur cluster biosynthesis transcriptional regulator SufR [Serratia quinivorans]CAI2051062.1 iron-sulf